MKALVFSAVREVTMQSVPDPSPASDEAVVRVTATGICGSDVTGFTGHSPRRRPGLILGHELVGTVAHVPAGDWPFALGDRVLVNPLRTCGVCRLCAGGRANICENISLLGMDLVPGSFAEYVAVPARNVFRAPAEMSDSQAVMVEPLAVGIHLLTLISRHNFDSMAILGAGTQGVLILSAARLLGYRDIAVVDTNPRRLAVAERFGASRLIDARTENAVEALKAFSGDRGVDIVVEAAGVTATRQAAVYGVRRGGEILLLGNHDIVSDVDLTHAVRSELRLQASYAYTPEDFRKAAEILARGDVSIESNTQVRALEDGQAAFDMLVTDPGDVLKVILRP
jgi:2-desacetyl-2-hydroxyethyl bacteriochlorophyllide A dehydrogenase